MLRLNCSRMGLKIKFELLKKSCLLLVSQFHYFWHRINSQSRFQRFFLAETGDKNFQHIAERGCLCRAGVYDDKVGGRFHFLSTLGVILFTLAIEVRHAVEALKLDRWLVAKFCRVRLFRVDSFLTEGDASRCIHCVSDRATMLIPPIQEYQTASRSQFRFP